MPLRNMTPEQRFISYEAHTGNNALVFNFKNSYFREMTVLARVVLCYPNYDEVKEGDKFYEPPKYFPDDPTGLQGKKLADCVGKTLKSTDPTNNDNFYLTLDLPENKHNNLIYRVDVLFYDNSNIDKWNYDPELSPVVWQDAKGYDIGNQNFYVVNNEPLHMHGNTLSRTYGPNTFCVALSYTDEVNRVWEYYWDVVNKNANKLTTAINACNTEYKWGLNTNYKVRLNYSNTNLTAFDYCSSNIGNAQGTKYVLDQHIPYCSGLREFPSTKMFDASGTIVKIVGTVVTNGKWHYFCPACGSQLQHKTGTTFAASWIQWRLQNAKSQWVTVNNLYLPGARNRSADNTIDTSQANAFFEQSK